MPKKDYQKRSLKNPFFKQKRNKKRKKKILYFLASLTILALLFYVLFYSPLFTIKNINVKGNDRTADYLIEDLVWQQCQKTSIFNISGDNLWFFSKDQLKEEMFLRLDLSNIRVKKTIPKTLNIIVEEREPIYVLKNQNNYQFRDIESCPINSLEVNNQDLKDYPIIKKGSLSEDDLDSCIQLNIDYVNEVIELYDMAKDFENFSFSEILLNTEVYNINLALKQGPEVFFSRRANFSKQLEKLNVIILNLKQESDTNIDDIKYIDVRYGDKAFINYK